MRFAWAWAGLATMFERPHHQRIGQILNILDGPAFKENSCLFGGGSAMALRFGEYRESVDIDFLVSDVTLYRNLRQLLTGVDGVAAIFQKGQTVVRQLREVRADQYGIRSVLAVANQPIKFEIVLEARVQLITPTAQDEICGIATLTPLDMATSKLLANSDRWGDDGAFSRDVIDLAMMNPSLALLRQAVAKAEGAYGKSIRSDLEKAIARLQTRHGWLERCMQAMAMTLPKALVWQHVRALRRVF